MRQAGPIGKLNVGLEANMYENMLYKYINKPTYLGFAMSKEGRNINKFALLSAVPPAGHAKVATSQPTSKGHQGT